jgi:hypothetical protein
VTTDEVAYRLVELGIVLVTQGVPDPFQEEGKLILAMT